MTFEQFQATRKECQNIGEVLADARWDGEPPAEGNLYCDALYIEKVGAHWPEAARQQGKWHLHIHNCEWISDDLEALERELYDYAVSEGYEA